jgi:ethanolaminephosphotransferase
MVFYSDVVPKDGLLHLKNYKYSAVDLSPVSKYILQPYWSWAVTLFPMWIAPNLITLLGFGFIIVNFVICVIYMPDMETPGYPSTKLDRLGFTSGKPFMSGAKE